MAFAVLAPNVAVPLFASVFCCNAPCFCLVTHREDKTGILHIAAQWSFCTTPDEQFEQTLLAPTASLCAGSWSPEPEANERTTSIEWQSP